VNETEWHMDDYPESIGKHSSDIMSPYVGSLDIPNELGAPLRNRRVSEIMADLYPNDPLLIRDVRFGAEARHIYERSSAQKPHYVTYGAFGTHPAYRVSVTTRWAVNIRFEYEEGGFSHDDRLRSLKLYVSPALVVTLVKGFSHDDRLRSSK
ncbi:MAG: hypothetical protein RML84_10350, partial [Anaerolineae bacterium]|nr:hypothetical protein [Anaerolineae bacterium]